MSDISTKVSAILDQYPALSDEDRRQAETLITQELKVLLLSQQKGIYKGLEKIKISIENTKKEISAADGSSAVSDAKLALDEVVKTTEQATDTILDQIEKIQHVIPQVQPEGAAGELSASTSRIVEACNFQDITGQLLQKVTATLQLVEDIVGTILDDITISNTKKSEKDSLMNGPALSGAASQDDIDKLFDA